MKKLFSFTLACLMILSLSVTAFAADMGVQIIGGPEAETEPVNLDDLKLNIEAEIDGWGTIKLTGFDFYDKLGYIANPDNGYCYDLESGNEADFAILRMDITNTTLKAKDYLSDVQVKVVYDDTYEYAGWCYQSDFNQRNQNYAINPERQFTIDPMYQGHYMFGCTLPNAVVNGKKPLQMIVTISGNEITYNIRK